MARLLSPSNPSQAEEKRVSTSVREGSPLSFDPAHVMVVLVQPQHPGNVGAVCRAMKNMGLSRLRLVDPPMGEWEQARWMAPGSHDVLEGIETFPSLEAALKDVGVVVGTTARERHWHFPILTARELGPYLLPKAGPTPAAILFGREDFGLDTASIARCEALVRIPTLGLSSLNLAQAVLLICYELMMAGHPDLGVRPKAVASLEERSRLVETLMRLALRVDFMRFRNHDELRARLHGLASRMGLEAPEVGLLLGFIRKISWHLDNRTEGRSAEPGQTGPGEEGAPRSES